MPANFQSIHQKINRLRNYVENDMPRIIGVEAVNHFKQSFVNQGFTDENLDKWPEVERRKQDSDWYGFKYGSRVAKPGKKRRKDNSITNYSPAATQRPILSGTTQELMNSLRWQKLGTGVLITSGTKYSKIINEGGAMKVFGRSGHTMPKRQFMGRSALLINKINRIVITDMKNILK